MPHELLRALADDVNRLLLAGTATVSGNEGLRKHALALRRLGRQVPVLAWVAEEVEGVVDAPSSKSAPALLNLALLCHQTRGGLASAGVAGVLEPVFHSGPWQTTAPAPEVAEVAGAVRRTGPGRAAILNEAVKHGIQPDLRLLGPALHGLHDRDGALADTVAEAVLPAIGRQALEPLRRDLDLGGKAPDARRLLAICKIAPDLGLELCRAALAEGSATVRLRALQLLAGLLPTEATEVAVSLLEGKPKDWKLRAAAVDVLSREPRRDKRTIAVLLGALDDGWRGNPGQAATALGKIGKAVVPALMERLTHPGAGVRLYAMWALREIGPDAAPAVPQLIEHIKDQAGYNSRWAIWALQAIGPKASPLIVPALEKALASGKPDVRVLAAAALVRFGMRTEATFEILTAALKNNDCDIQRFATDALSEIGPKGALLIPFLLGALANDNFTVRRCAAQILGATGEADAVLPLVRALEDENWVVRYDAIHALTRIGPRANAAVPALTALLSYPIPLVQEKVREALDSIQRKK